MRNGPCYARTLSGAVPTSGGWGIGKRLTEDQFLKVSSSLGVDRVRHGESGDKGTVYVYVRFDRTEGRHQVVRMAKQVWPYRPIVILVTVPTNPPETSGADDRD